MADISTAVGSATIGQVMIALTAKDMATGVIKKQIEETTKKVRQSAEEMQKRISAVSKAMKDWKEARKGMGILKKFFANMLFMDVKILVGLIEHLRLFGKIVSSVFGGVVKSGLALFGLVLGSALKSSESFQKSAKNIGENLKAMVVPAVQMVLPLINTLMSALDSLTSKLASFVNGLFGKTLASSKKQLKKLKSDTGSATKQLRRFDEINKLEGNGGGSSTAEGLTADNELADNLKAKLAEILTFFQPIIDAFATLWDSAKNLAKTFFEVVLPPLVETIKPILGDILVWVRDKFAEAILWVAEKLDWLAEWFVTHQDDIKSFLQNLYKFWTGFWNGLAKPALDAFIKFIGDRLESMFIFVGGIVSAIITVFTGLLQFINGVFTGDWELAWKGIKNILIGVFNGILTVIEWCYNAVIDFINGMINAINESGLAKALKEHTSFQGFNTINKAQFERIPQLANGGVISQPTLAMMGEYSGASSNPEIVAPQSIMAETFATAMIPLIEAIQQMGNEEVHIHLDSSMSAFARTITPYLDAESRRKGTRLVVEA